MTEHSLRIEDIIEPERKQRSGVCPICEVYHSELTEHHIRKRVIFGRKGNNYYVIFICEDCHIAVEREVSRREKIVLRSYRQDIYEDTILSFVEGRIPVRQRRRRRRR